MVKAAALVEPIRGGTRSVLAMPSEVIGGRGSMSCENAKVATVLMER